MTKYTMELTGLDALVKLLVPRNLYWDIVKRKLEDLGAAGEAEAKESAATFRRTGRLYGSITHQVNFVPKPLWVAVRVSAASDKGKRYPWILEFSEKHRHKQWLFSAVGKAQQRASSLVASAAQEIMARWSQ